MISLKKEGKNLKKISNSCDWDYLPYFFIDFKKFYP